MENIITFVKTIKFTFMNQRLEQFLKAENITQAQFADVINVARASISHILSGRNKPGFEFIQNMAFHYPNLNLDWLITGKGKMYKNNLDSSPITEGFQKQENLSLFSKEESDLNYTKFPSKSYNEYIPQNILEEKESIFYNGPKENNKKINKVIILYNDNTYKEIE